MPIDADDRGHHQLFPRRQRMLLDSADSLRLCKPHVASVSSLDAEARISQKGSEALVLLLEAYEYACQLSRRRWQFAVEIECLQAAGLSNSDLRWLLGRGLVRHAYETTMPENAVRRFCKQASPRFSERSCFVLTREGVQFIQRLLGISPGQAVPPTAAERPAIRASQAGRPIPRWDPQRRELYLNDKLVKRFKAPASNQEMILAAFEEECWPARIDDPLPPRLDLDPKRRLHATINSLNRRQKSPLIRFLGDGTGEGLRWELVASQALPAPVRLEVDLAACNGRMAAPPCDRDNGLSPRQNGLP